MTAYSIIITARDQPELLQRAVGTIRTQSFRSAQVIILSDRPGSGAFEAVAPLLGEADVFIQRARPCPHAVARNTCLSFVEGRAFLFLDEGDAFTEGYLRELFPFLDPARATYADYHIVVEEVARGGNRPLCAWPKSLAGRDLNLADHGPPVPAHCVAYPGWLAREQRFDEADPSFTDWTYLREARTRLSLVHAAVSGPIVYARTVASEEDAGSTVPAVEDVLRTSFGAISGVRAAVASRTAGLADAKPGFGGPVPPVFHDTPFRVADVDA